MKKITRYDNTNYIREEIYIHPTMVEIKIYKKILKPNRKSLLKIHYHKLN